MNIKYAEDFTDVKCECCEPECSKILQEIFFRARCHLRGHLSAVYDVPSQVLKLSCAECGSGIVQLKVASKAVEVTVVSPN